MSNRIFLHLRTSPVGPLLLLSDGDALVGLYTPGISASRAAPRGAILDFAPFRDVSEKLDRYFAGVLTQFDVPLRLAGTPFQRAVWAALVAIPYGTTISYRELAARIGNPRAVRAVGAANGRNPVSIIVPCHRVIGADGALVGYGGGLDCKRWLLNHEHARGPEGVRRTSAYGSSTARAAAVAR
ncbi:MAG TPA: methylated-DNA--[protein]-cysteine S-methyltransferase [Polyangiaceae bacterium]|nr:methylated-DNA--[protein]-cysteine S-methyltransferase [Polyangiaceae bacterium]